MSYPLISPRLRIAPLTSADIAAFVAYRQDPDIARYQGWDVTYSEQDAEKLIAGQPTSELAVKGGWLQLAVHDAESNILLGDVAVHTLIDQPDTYEIGVTFARVAQGKGLATEAVKTVIDHLFKHVAAHRIVARCDLRNVAVAKLLKRVGMRHESRAVESDYFKGEWSTLDGWAILAREYEPS